MDEVGKILPAVFRRQAERMEPPVAQILAPLWPRVAGKAMARQCRPVAFCHGTLTLVTEDESWSLQLQQMAEQICAEINAFLGGPIVKRLCVRQVLSLGPAERMAPYLDLPRSGKSPPEFKDGAASPPAGFARVAARAFERKRLSRERGKVH
jgi:hypothetical protein